VELGLALLISMMGAHLSHLSSGFSFSLKTVPAGANSAAGAGVAKAIPPMISDLKVPALMLCRSI
jgi:hypothetical protein